MKIKTIATLLLTCFLSASGLRAQTSDSARHEKSYAIGLYAGANYPFFAATGTSAIAPAYMIYGEWQMNPKWSLSLGAGMIGYNGKNLKHTDSANVYDTVDVKHTTITRMGYFSVPLLAKYKMGSHASVQAGIRASWVISVSGTGEYGNYFPPKKDSFIRQADLVPSLPAGASSFDLSGVLAFEYAFSKRLHASLIYNYGFIPVFPASFSQQPDANAGNHNVSLQLGLHYIFYNYQGR